MIVPSDRVPDPEIVHESMRAIAETPAFDVAPRSEEPRSEEPRRERDDARPSHDTERIAEPAQFIEAERTAPPPRVEVAAAPERPIERQRPVEVARPVVDVPPITSTLPPDSGLEIVETRFKPAPEPEPEAMPAGRQRVRPQRVEIAEEPLQIVETRKSEQPPAG